MAEIDFETKTNRELLILTVQKVNTMSEETLPAIISQVKVTNGTLRDHEKRLIIMETYQKIADAGCENNENGSWFKRQVRRIATSYLGALLTLIALIGALYTIGKVLGWWQ